MRLFTLLILLTLIPIFPAHAETSQQKTVIKDQAEADLLLGDHLFADRNISIVGNMGSYSNFGKAAITYKDDIYTLNAELECYSQQAFSYFEPRGGYVKINGQISHIKKNEFIVRGQLKLFYLPNRSGRDKGRVCETSGQFIFSRVHTEPDDIDKDFWSLVVPKDGPDDQTPQEIGIDCMQYVSSVDIFVDRQEPKVTSTCVKDLRDFPKLYQ